MNDKYAIKCEVYECRNELKMIWGVFDIQRNKSMLTQRFYKLSHTEISPHYKHFLGINKNSIIIIIIIHQK